MKCRAAIFNGPCFCSLFAFRIPHLIHCIVCLFSFSGDPSSSFGQKSNNCGATTMRALIRRQHALPRRLARNAQLALICYKSGGTAIFNGKKQPFNGFPGESGKRSRAEVVR
ncbi:hypothetical protein M431DRAFT_373844 [Trichoderma harzianum CBS 226.95]|uniref:Secreted protein n=1 Tax=Trichoderma harzianum CBS 226.95 TaxID=983964 RepID=A0A2T4AH23_TRIHA|nr:hypothetical protein M431DRAFT_373844 [Trichoderma harzianum CBS 226.95]PTB56357.1 hypothetical protein M431DRAFT_373844 [Trichoderma harzianum CBS 226.95]